MFVHARIARRFFTLCFLTSSAILITALPASGQGSSSSRSPVDLSGKWKLDSAPGGVVLIDHLLATDLVAASFSPGLKCHTENRVKLLSSRLRVGSDETKLSLEDGTIWLCTEDKAMIGSCGAEIWESKTRNVAVAPDGNTISGERFYEWYVWDDLKNGKYVNCRRDPSRDKWVTWTLERMCRIDKRDRCEAISEAIRSVRTAMAPGRQMSAAEWNTSIAQFSQMVSNSLDRLRDKFCEDETAARAKVDELKALLTGLGQARTAAQAVAERRKLARIELDLMVMSTQTCAVSQTPPPPATGICAEGVPPKKPGDNEAIDQAIKPLNDAIKEAKKQLEDFERQAQGGANTTAGQYADYWRTRLGQLQRARAYWDLIKSASCIPPDLMAAIRAMAAGRTDMCTDLCWETAKWIETWYPGPNGEIQKKIFLEGCGFSCP